MPKIKTNRMASKKFRRTGKGKFKRAQARTSHNTGKMRPKRKRFLRQRRTVLKENMSQIGRMLPYA